jgi:hypothetical protein
LYSGSGQYSPYWNEGQTLAAFSSASQADHSPSRQQTQDLASPWVMDRATPGMSGATSRAIRSPGGDPLAGGGRGGSSHGSRCRIQDHMAHYEGNPKMMTGESPQGYLERPEAYQSTMGSLPYSLCNRR